MTDDRLLLGIDIGTSSSVGALATLDGEVVAMERVAHGFDMPQPGWAEQDADAVWWADFCAISRALIAKAEIDPERIAAVACSAIAPTMLPLDDADKPLRPAILYGIDTRAGQEIADLTDALGEETIFVRTGQSLSAQSVGPKVLWYQRNQPDLFRRTRKILTAASYLVLRLTGRAVVDNYVAPYFTPFFDVHELAWHRPWVERVCPLEWLPETLWSGEQAGVVTERAARETGIPKGTPVAVGTADALAEAIAAGVTEPGDMMVMYGTTLFLIQLTARYQPHRDLWASVGALPGEAILAAGMSTAGALLSWFRDELARDEKTRADASGRNAFAALSEAAVKIPAGSDGLITLPYFSGERTPINDVNARGLIFGLTLSHKREHIYRSFLESIGYGLRHNIEAMGAANALPKRLVAIGGGAQDPLWLQICCDITGLPQDLPSRAVGAAYGDAYLAGMAAGIFDDWRVLRERWVKIARRVRPNPQTEAIYNEGYAIYRGLYQDTKALMARLGAWSTPLGRPISMGGRSRSDTSHA